jgi:hypothetical protein
MITTLVNLHLHPFVESKTAVNLVEACRSDDPFQETVETQAAEEATNEIEDAAKQKRNAADDLSQGFC